MDDPASTTQGEPADANSSGDDLQILTEILAAFRKLEPESRERMLITVATFLGIGPRATAETFGPRPKVGILTSPPHGATGSVEPTFSEDRSISPKDFMLEKQPMTDVERVACLGYYLTHYRGMPYFKALDISKLNTEAAQVKFADATVALNNALKQNYLAQASKGAKQLSALGERFVLALPDREKARNTMASARPRRKARKANQQETDDQQ